jgi:hypothetical protein
VKSVVEGTSDETVTDIDDDIPLGFSRLLVGGTSLGEGTEEEGCGIGGGGAYCRGRTCLGNRTKACLVSP